MNVAQWLQIYFFATTALIVVPLGFEPLRDRFLAYGARAGRVRPPTSAGTGVSMRPRLDRLAGIRVPHSWFSHFYLFVLLLSAFWAVQWWTSGRLLRRVVTSNDDDDDNGVGMSADQVRLMWLLLVVQGARRCYESLAWTRPSAATMWIGHWVLSLAFYAAMSVAIWIEGRSSLRAGEPRRTTVRAEGPSWRTLACLSLFALASCVQSDCHRHLFALKKYSRPTRAPFRHLICPHYTAECLIYLSWSLLAAPPERWINQTLLAGLIFVVVNLGITAMFTRTFYAERFGEEAVRGRWCMIPWVF